MQLSCRKQRANEASPCPGTCLASILCLQSAVTYSKCMWCLSFKGRAADRGHTGANYHHSTNIAHSDKPPVSLAEKGQQRLNEKTISSLPVCKCESCYRGISPALLLWLQRLSHGCQSWPLPWTWNLWCPHSYLQLTPTPVVNTSSKWLHPSAC